MKLDSSEIPRFCRVKRHGRADTAILQGEESDNAETVHFCMVMRPESAKILQICKAKKPCSVEILQISMARRTGGAEILPVMQVRRPGNAGKEACQGRNTALLRVSLGCAGREAWQARRLPKGRPGRLECGQKQEKAVKREVERSGSLEPSPRNLRDTPPKY